MALEAEQLIDLRESAPIVGLFDDGLAKGHYDGGFKEFDYRRYAVTAFLPAERQTDPGALVESRFQRKDGVLIPCGIVRETQVGRWLYHSREFGYSNLEFHPLHHDAEGKDRPLDPKDVVLIEEDPEAKNVGSTLFDKLEKEAPIEKFLVIGDRAISGFISAFSEANDLQEKKDMPFYQAGYYIDNADATLRAIVTMSYMSGFDMTAGTIPEEHRYRVMVNLAWSICNRIVANRSSLDYFNERRTKVNDQPDLSPRGAVEYLYSHPFRELMRGSGQDTYYQLEPIIGAYSVEEEELLELTFRLWLADNYFRELERIPAPLEKDAWGGLYEGNEFFEWAKQFYVRPSDKWSEDFASGMSAEQYNKYRSIVRATVLATVRSDYSVDIPELYGWEEFVLRSNTERKKPIHSRASVE